MVWVGRNLKILSIPTPAATAYMPCAIFILLVHSGHSFLCFPFFSSHLTASAQ